MRPAAELFNQLIEWQTKADDRLAYFFGGHSLDTDISSLAQAMLRGLCATYGFIDLLGAECAVDDDRQTKTVPQWLQDVDCQLTQIRQFRGIRDVGFVPIRYRQFLDAEVGCNLLGHKKTPADECTHGKRTFSRGQA
ncbi:hypothetical protein PQD76_gp12 [Stenotrophomonas phage BUCT626]|uniref:Uncharacterized protein n=1 Tax=Stenotrophomonas phage BUCT626 TaxID=2860376 RepID=A0AC61NA29_9CAUD|nr:hypothetical protein PQD76_gp12 [Stenotrophomonas phage BUCT626]QYC96716.1 hypothetical protein [Stenotrophomonas phage BUCT626]